MHQVLQALRQERLARRDSQLVVQQVPLDSHPVLVQPVPEVTSFPLYSLLTIEIFFKWEILLFTFSLSLSIMLHASLPDTENRKHSSAAGAFGAKFAKKGAISKTFVSGHSKAFGKVALYGHDKAFSFGTVKAAGAAGGAVGGGGKKGSFSKGGHAEGFKKGAIGGKAGFAAGAGGAAGFKTGAAGASGFGKKVGYAGKAGGFKTIGLGGGFPAYAHGAYPSAHGIGHDDISEGYGYGFPSHGLGGGIISSSPYHGYHSGLGSGHYESSPYGYPSVSRYGY